MTVIRPAAVAGQFYPGTKAELDASVQHYLNLAERDAKPGRPIPKAIIAPHAGYIYSGAVAATAYARLRPAAERITRVVLLGPCHRVPVQGLAVSGADGFATPLGNIPIDAEARKTVLKLPQVQVVDATHAQEHSLEVHLPFLQVILDDFTLLPLVVGMASAEDVAGVLEAVWGGPETFIVISSDLSHYLDYDAARRIDAETCRAIENLDHASIGRDQACGRIPVSGLLELAQRWNLKVETVDLRNSGDTAGPRDHVVGYGAWVFMQEPSGGGGEKKSVETDFEAATERLLKVRGPELLRLAARSILHGLDHGAPVPTSAAEAPADLAANGACFVTLKKSGRLRGCIGSPEAHRPLVVDVADNAYRSAFKDPRFPALAAEEVPELSVSLSVLSPAAPMAFDSEAELLAMLRPRVDGLIIQDGQRRALFLPSVWDQLQDPKAFLQRLKMKAGLPADHWSEDFKASRFVAGEYSTEDLDDPGSVWH